MTANNEQFCSVDCSSDGTEDEKVTYSITEQLFELLQSKGFSENAIKKSIVAGCIDESTCTQWINMHEGHPELDTPLEEGITVIIKPKRILTEEERAKKVEELREKAKEKKLAREAEEKADELRREKERIEFRKTAGEIEKRRSEMLKEKKLRDEKNEIELDAKARRRAKLKIKIDAFVRTGKSVEDATVMAEVKLREEEEEAARKKEETKKIDRAARVNVAAPQFVVLRNALNVLEEIYAEPLPDGHKAASLLKCLKECDGGAQAASLLKTIVSNICSEPLNTKVRVLKTTTNSFTNKILPYPDLLRILRFCDFDMAEDAEGNKVLISNLVLLGKIKEVLALL